MQVTQIKNSSNNKYVSLKLGFVMAPGRKGSRIIINPIPLVAVAGFGLVLSSGAGNWA